MQLRAIVAAATLFLPAFLPSCDSSSSWFYDRTDTGSLKGKLIVEWIDQDKFIFLPDAQEPLTFVRKNKEVIRPERMFTDGGSIPTPLRAIKSYSPWGYAPAYIVHDWLFVMKHCKVSGFETYDLDKAATILAEVMKTVMENPKYGGPNKLVLYSIYEAVRTPVAKDYWDNGTCDTPSGPRSMSGPELARKSAQPMARSEPSNPARRRDVISF
jgi:Protein of unknown function (DUF1353)